MVRPKPIPPGKVPAERFPHPFAEILVPAAHVNHERDKAQEPVETRAKAEQPIARYDGDETADEKSGRPKPHDEAGASAMNGAGDDDEQSDES